MAAAARAAEVFRSFSFNLLALALELSPSTSPCVLGIWWFGRARVRCVYVCVCVCEVEEGEKNVCEGGGRDSSPLGAPQPPPFSTFQRVSQPPRAHSPTEAE